MKSGGFGDSVGLYCGLLGCTVQTVRKCNELKYEFVESCGTLLVCTGCSVGDKVLAELVTAAVLELTTVETSQKDTQVFIIITLQDVK